MTTMRLTFVALSVTNLEKSVGFYRTVLGLPLHGSSHDEQPGDPWFGGPHAAYSWTDDAFLHFAIYPVKEPARPATNAVQLGFHVDHFDEVHERVSRSGIKIVQAPRDEPWGRTARYLDPDGNIVSITAR